MLYWTDYDKTYAGSSRGGNTEHDVSDTQAFTHLGFKQQWEWEISDRQLLTAGFEARRVKGSYDFEAEANTAVPLAGQDPSEYWRTDLEETGTEYTAFVSHRMRPADDLVLEAGLRYDRQSVLEESQLSPRLNLAWEIPSAGTLRLAWGEFNQAPRIHEFDVEGDLTRFGTVEKATHALLGYDQRIGRRIDFRVELYHKDIKDVRQRHVNLFDPVAPAAQFEDDRVTISPVSGEAYGAELTLKQNLGGNMSWFFNYTYAKAEDKLADGTRVPRPWDQPHSVNLSFNYRRSQRWNFNLSWRYHTGWPTTAFWIENTAAPSEEPIFQIATGPWYQERLDAYHRLDFRVNRRVAKKNGNAFNIYLDVTNLYNRKNPSGYGDMEIIYDESGRPSLIYETETWLPIMPSFGFSWVF
jgi:outer membrane receptor for ferrienterochelin and colicin